MGKLTDAVQNNNVEEIRDLLDGKKFFAPKYRNNPLLNTETDKKTYTALHIAAQKGYIKILILLLEAGANVDETTNEGRTPLWLAAAADQITAVEELIKAKANIKKTDDYGFPPLYFAIYYGCSRVVKVFIKAGIDINEPLGRTENSPLWLAVDSRQIGCVGTLLGAGADINQPKYEPLLWRATWNAIHNPHLENSVAMFEYLLDKGAKVNVEGSNGQTPLWIVANDGKKVEMVKRLLDAGAEVNHPDKDGKTPLNAAAAIINSDRIEKVKEIVKILLARGADPNVKDKDGKTPLDIAKEKNNKDIINLLQEHQKFPSQVSASLQGAKTGLKEVLSSGLKKLQSLTSEINFLLLQYSQQTNVDIKYVAEMQNYIQEVRDYYTSQSSAAEIEQAITTLISHQQNLKSLTTVTNKSSSNMQKTLEIKELRKKAEQGDAFSQEELGFKYMEGSDGLSQDYKEAAKWYRRAAEKGNSYGQNNLGLLYLNGQGEEQNDKEAIKWFCLAAEQKNMYGEYNLGWMYEQGRGVERDITQAREWYQKAADAGHEDAKKAVERLQNQTSEKAKLLNELDQIITTAEKMEGSLHSLFKATTHDMQQNPKLLAKFKENKLFKSKFEVEERLETKVSTLTNDPTSIQEKLPIKSSVTLASAVPEPRTDSKMQIPIQEWNSTLQRLRENDPSLTSLYLWYKKIGDNEVEELSETLKTNRILTSLDLATNEIGDKGMIALSEALKTNRTLKSLSLRSNQIGDKGIQKLSEVLKVNYILTALNVSHNPITAQGAQALCEMLRINPTLTEIGLKIDLRGIELLSEILSTYGVLTWLSLPGCQIGNDEIQVLSKGLKQNQSIRALHLWSNQIEDKGLQALGEIFSTNYTLRILNLTNNQIGDEGVKAFSEKLKYNSTLSSLNLSDNRIKAEGARALCEIFRVNRSLRSLDIFNNLIGDEGIQGLVEILKNNCTLSDLNLGRINITNRAAEALRDLLKTNHVITQLNLLGNRINVEIEKEISSLCEANRKLCDQFNSAIWNNRLSLAQSLLKQGVSIFSVSNDGKENTALHWAVVYADKVMVEWLLQEMQSRKIPLTFRNKEGKTAEDLAKNKPTVLALFPKMELLQSASLPSNLDSKADVNDGKSWHFDPQIKPSSIPNDVPYILIDGSHKDKEKISQLYLRDPIPGKSVGRVQVIYNPTLNRSFELRMRSLEQRHGESAFAPQWHTENDPEWRKQVDQLCQTLTASYTDPNYPHVKIALAWHGTDPAALPSIFKTGFASLAKTDTGFFGKGYYFTFNVGYAQRVYSKGALLLSCVSFYSAYPTIDGDKPKLQEKGNYKNYDAHFVPVIPPSGKFSYDTTVYYPCKPNQKHQYVEVVVFDAGQCFPEYVVELQDNLLKAPSNPLKQEEKKEETKPEQKSKNAPVYYSEKNPHLIFDKKKLSQEVSSITSSHSNLEKGFK